MSDNRLPSISRSQLEELARAAKVELRDERLDMVGPQVGRLYQLAESLREAGLDGAEPACVFRPGKE